MCEEKWNESSLEISATDLELNDLEEKNKHQERCANGIELESDNQSFLDDSHYVTMRD